MSRLVLGVDGGGTSTVAQVAASDGRILGRSEVGPSNMKATGEAAGLLAIRTAITLAMSEAATDHVHSACLGLAGIDHEDDRARVETWCREQAFSDRVFLVNHAELVLAAGTPECWGVALISGTGSIGVGRSPSGERARAGGWGHVFGDEGSGYGTAIAALRLVARRFDGRVEGDWRDDPLSHAICRATEVPDPSALVSRVYSPEFDRPRIARLASVVVQAARIDPGLHDELLEPAGEALAEIVLALARRLELPCTSLPLALAGGFLLSSEGVESTLIRRVREAGYSVRPCRVSEPVAGAIKLALAP